ncbi:chromosome partitioning protein, ParB family [Variovorax sp. OK605]|uniref:ParB/RepB/Spo0J family partition protein n=1 Tax=Variovorax sp. OK605 TaxID=1855317 RepID=UPI0008E8E549|nr:ParB/RepB/Spo0J family partition protein [Variovorax sp. OK605]SFQ58944.1 chromosome partitioning protein, ParB family [Variovorax sp. OK605]
MANKNLVKRAFSVTANLPVRTEAAGVSAPGQESAPVPLGAVRLDSTEAAASHEPVLPPRAPAAAPRTSPGSMLAFMAEQSEVHKEVVELRRRLEEFDGADVTRRLDPRDISVSRWANRDRAHFATQAFLDLKAEIQSSGGNIQPIKVRAVSPAEAGAQRYEIVYGHRRHQACLELGIPVLALIDHGMKDTDLFVEMDRENRAREDLSPWEQGVMYSRALDEGLFPSAKQMAAALGVDMGTISKAKTLRSLPADVVAAFSSPLELQFRWGKLLTDALQKDPEGVLERARTVATQLPRPSAADTLKILIQATGAKRRREGTAEWLDPAGNRVASLNTDRKGKATILVEALDESQQRRLIKLLDGFLGLKAE